MATTIKGGSIGKEKRGLSPSNPVTKKSLKSLSSAPASSSNSPSDEKARSPTDGKPVPNYLRPTISSSLDFSRLPKRPETDSSAQKPVLNRRRSFDRPPPASQVQKAIRNVAGLHKPFRSSSFSSKPTTPVASSSTKPAPLEKSSVKKDPKVDPRLSKSRSLKKSTLSSSTKPVKKDSDGASSSTSSKKGPKSVTSESSIDYETRSVDHLIIEDDMVNIDHEVESLPEISEMPECNEELGDPTNILVEEKPHVEEVNKDTLLEDDHHQEDKSPTAEQVADEPAVLESAAPEQHHDQKEDQKVEEEPEPENVEESADHQPEVESAEQVQTGEGAGDQDEVEQEAPKEEPIETLAEEMKEDELPEKEAELGGEETEAKEEHQSADGSAAETSAAETSAAPVKAQAAGKKENQAYNDVIEETATKLRGKKNKVLALAGAFETVISLQDTNKN